MRGINKKRALLVSSAIILLCVAIIAGMTYALFTDTILVDHHLKGGQLNITLKRTNLKTYTLNDATGFLSEAESNEIVDFSGATTRNVFDFDDNTRLVPCAYYEATMEISNVATTSDVAYGYWLEIKLDTTGLTDKEIEDLKIDEQMKLTVDVVDSGAHMEKYLSEGLFLGASDDFVGVLGIGESDTFKVKVELVSDAANNSAMSQDVNFDLVVHAIQRTTK